MIPSNVRLSRLAKLNPFITNKKSQNCANIRYYPTACSEAGTVCIVKLCVCTSTALHCSKYPNFLEGMKVGETCIA